MAQAQGREGRRRAVLSEEAPVERRRRPERERQADEETRAHCSAARLANGRYASAASAATPTRGRSRRRSYTTNRRCHSGKNLRLKRSRLSSWKCHLSARSAFASTFCSLDRSASGARSAANGEKLSDTRGIPSPRAHSIASHTSHS